MNKPNVSIDDATTERTIKEIDKSIKSKQNLKKTSLKSLKSNEYLEVNSIKSSLLNETSTKSEINLKQNASILPEKTIKDNQNIKITFNDDEYNLSDISAIKKKATNLKLGNSILKNKSSNFFLTNIETYKNTNNIINLQDNSFTNNLHIELNPINEKPGNVNLHKVNFDERNLVSNSNLSKINKNISNTSEENTQIKNKNNIKKKRNKKNISNNLDISKSTSINGTMDPSNINNSLIFEFNQNLKNCNNKEIPLFKKFETAIPIKQQASKIVENKRESKIINLSFSDKDSDESFMIFQKKINSKKQKKNLFMSDKRDRSNLLVRNCLPPIKAALNNSIVNSDAISLIEYKIKKLDQSAENPRIERFSPKEYTKGKIRLSIFNNIELIKNKCYNEPKDNVENNNEIGFSKKNDIKEKTNLLNKSNLSPQIINNRNVFNLNLPKLRFHKQNKSHFDIMQNITKDLKSCSGWDNESNYTILPNMKPNLQSFMVQKKNPKEFDNNFNDYSSFDNEIIKNLENDDVLNTEEKNIRVVNLKRIKPKRLPLDIDRPQHNKSRQNLKAQLFLKKFINKCKSEHKNVNSVISDISTNIVNTNEYYKNDKINIVRKLIAEEMHQGIDKELFLMDNPRDKREKAIMLKGPRIKGENRYLFENKNSPLLVGEIISNINEDFALKCKDVVKDRLIILNSQQKRRKKLIEDAQNEKIKEAKNAEFNIKVEKAFEKIKKTKMNALKQINYD